MVNCNYEYVMLQHVLNSQNSTLNPLTLIGSQCNAPQMEISGAGQKMQYMYMHMVENQR